MKDIVIIAVGRNESKRLVQTLSAAQSVAAKAIVYVDSLSTDNSIEIAKKYTSHIVSMHSDDHPSAAHARNLGIDYVLKNFSDIHWIQFIDADCELVLDWPATAITYSKDKQKLGALCGYRNEKHPNNSVYNLLSQMNGTDKLE
jgi:glycosyltransferase involved in cell wall biosynthesis